MISISVSLVAAFTPLLFMTGVVGRVFREFSVTLAFAIAVSTVVSLTLTPMICAHFVRKPPSPNATWFDRAVERVMTWFINAYAESLSAVLRHQGRMMLVLLGVVVLTVGLYIKTPRGYFPADDTGLIWGGTPASTETSFQAMFELQQKATDIVLADPAVAGVGSSIGTSAWNSSVNRGQLFISLKPLSERKVSAWDVVNRLRPKLTAIPGLRVFMFPMQDVRSGARSADSSYQYTIWGPTTRN